jgi:hypothetical protein
LENLIHVNYFEIQKNKNLDKSTRLIKTHLKQSFEDLEDNIRVYKTPASSNATIDCPNKGDLLIIPEQKLVSSGVLISLLLGKSFWT